MKKIKLFMLISIILISSILFISSIYEVFSNNEVITNTTSNNTLVSSSTLSMMLETKAASGVYEVSSDTSWPTSGYNYNSTLSKCTNGSTLTWDSDNATIVFSGTTADTCYVYFDLIPTIADVCDTGDNLAECIQELYTVSGEGTVGIYYHDGTGDYGSLEAQDYSYRYSGATEDVLNYVCFGSDDCTDTDNLYQIIGIFKNDDGDYEIKLVKYEYCTSSMCGEDGDYAGNGAYYWNYTNYYSGILNSNGNANDWAYSLLNTTNLNTFYIDNLEKLWSNLITTHTWIVGGNSDSNLTNVTANVTYSNEILNYDTEEATSSYPGKIGLMYVSDYVYAANPTCWSATLSSNYYNASSNWMYKSGYSEWLITRLSGTEFYAFKINFSSSIAYYDIDYAYYIRPAFYLSTLVEYSSGTGTESDPIILVTE